MPKKVVRKNHRGVATTNLRRTRAKVNEYLSCSPTDIDRKSQNLCHLYPGMGLTLGVFGFFPLSK